MKVYYISPSLMPSRTANSIHVIHMCASLAQLGNEVTLFVQRSIADRKDLKNVLEDYYGVNLDNVCLVSCFSTSLRAVNIRIALLFIAKSIFTGITPGTAGLVISRNLYASVVLRCLYRCHFIFETHTLEPSGYRKFFQKILLQYSRSKTVVISHALKDLLSSWHGLPSVKAAVLHDAAVNKFKKPFLPEEKQRIRRKIFSNSDREGYRSLVGYFGHLYIGRGIEIVQGLAKKHPDLMFLIFGGNEGDIEKYRSENKTPNLYFMGYIPPSLAPEAMGMMDILLMPYQKKVSIGVPCEDTGRWMSPLKMFEYMASGVPLIASSLPVLEEVLRDKHNCLLAVPDDAESWSGCVDMLLADRNLAKQIAAIARAEYEQEYNWKERARQIMELVK